MILPLLGRLAWENDMTHWILFGMLSMFCVFRTQIRSGTDPHLRAVAAAQVRE